VTKHTVRADHGCDGSYYKPGDLHKKWCHFQPAKNAHSWSILDLFRANKGGFACQDDVRRHVRKHEHGAQLQEQARRDLCKLPSLQFHQR
jgi:hypothetical protein